MDSEDRLLECHPLSVSLDILPIASIVVDHESRIVFANRSAATLFGWPADELVGNRLDVLIPERFREAHIEHEARFRGTPASRLLADGMTIWACRRDGNEVPVQIGLSSWANKGKEYVVACIGDVSRQHEVAEALSASEERFRIVAEKAVDILQTVDVENDIVVHHSDVDALMNYSPGEFPNTISGWFELVHPDDQERIKTELEQAIAAGVEEWYFEYRVLAGDGSYHHWIDRGTVTEYLEDGSVNIGAGAIQDVTEQVEARQRLEAALAEVQSLSERLAAESTYLQEEIRASHDCGQIIGQSDVWMRVLDQVRLVAGTDSTVMLLGETGTGKELVARCVHAASARSDRPLIKVNCAALPSTLIESELFGHEKGAFTGADAARDGRFKLADGGTLFLDEIGELPLDLQAKLLQAVQDGTFERLGSSKPLQVDVRVIAATNCDLLAAVREGRFRSDLYYRLAVFPIELPSLRDRRDDIPLLVTYFLSRPKTAKDKSILTISESTMAALQAYDWPGNVRELENVIERGVIVSTDGTLKVDICGPRSPRNQRATDRTGRASITPQTEAPNQWTAPVETLKETERAHVISILEACGWTVKGQGNAADRLGLKESTLRSRMKKLGIQRPSG